VPFAFCACAAGRGKPGVCCCWLLLSCAWRATVGGLLLPGLAQQFSRESSAGDKEDKEIETTAIGQRMLIGRRIDEAADGHQRRRAGLNDYNGLIAVARTGCLIPHSAC
jgi:hypothetical protein